MFLINTRNIWRHVILHSARDAIVQAVPRQDIIHRDETRCREAGNLHWNKFTYVYIICRLYVHLCIHTYTSYTYIYIYTLRLDSIAEIGPTREFSKLSGAKIAKPVNLEFRRRPTVANSYDSDAAADPAGPLYRIYAASILKIHLT